MAEKDDTAAELALQKTVVAAVAARNQELIDGANPDPNVGTGFYGGEAPVDRMAAARAAKAAKAAK